MRESGCYGRRSVLADSWSQDGLVQTLETVYSRDSSVQYRDCVSYISDKVKKGTVPTQATQTTPRRRGTFLQILGEGVERPRGKRS